jgi:hypothetical protein
MLAETTKRRAAKRIAEVTMGAGGGEEVRLLASVAYRPMALIGMGTGGQGSRSLIICSLLVAY